MTATKKTRSRFWVVSTHVLTTGFAMPAVAGMIGYPLINTVAIVAPVRAFLLLLTVQALGYIGGVYYSLSYIRKVALVENAPACIKPSIITFVVLAVFGFGLNLASLFTRQSEWEWVAPALAIPGLLLFYVLICVAFAKITQQGFTNMPSGIPETSRRGG
jgi:hypothetical protein